MVARPLPSLVVAPSLGALSLILSAASFGCGAPAAEANPIAAPAATLESDAPREVDSTLEILCNPPTPILIDGKPVGTSPLKKIKVAPGSHDVTFADPEAGNRTLVVKVEPGESKTVISDRPPAPGKAH